MSTKQTSTVVEPKSSKESSAVNDLEVIREKLIKATQAEIEKCDEKERAVVEYARATMAVKSFFNVPNLPTSISTGETLLTFQYSFPYLTVVIDRNHFAPSMPLSTLQMIHNLKAEIEGQEQIIRSNKSVESMVKGHLDSVEAVVETKKKTGDSYENQLEEIAEKNEELRNVQGLIAGAKKNIENCESRLSQLEASLPKLPKPKQNATLVFEL